MNAYEQKVMSALPSRVRQIVIEEAQRHDVPIHLIFSRRKRSDVIMARWAAMYRTKAGNPSLSAPQIGDIFDRDHTTVLSGLARYSAITGNPPLTSYDISKRVTNPALYKGMQL
jgi:chromosomal replication initiation ATPase DnaA